MSVDGGVLTHPEGRPKGASANAHIGFGGGGTPNATKLLALSIDTRVDVASGGSRWAAGGSVLGGIRVPGAFLEARVGVWRAIVSGADEAKAVPSFELGAYIPLNDRFDPKQPMHGESSTGINFGLREDIDDARYLTVFVGYSLFIIPGY
jgi:hypothetical protein